MGAVSYSPSIVTMALSCISSDINTNIGRKIMIFSYPLCIQRKHKKSKSIKYTHNIGLDAKAHVGLLDCLHVAHKNNTKTEMIYNHT